MKTFLILLGSVFVLASSCSTDQKADLIIENGKVVTVDKDFSYAEAIAVADGKIIFVGLSDEVQIYKSDDTRIIDAEGLLVLPGLTDAHAHIVSLGNQLANLEISSCNSFEAIVEAVKKEAESSLPGEWIIGGRWNHTLWQDSSLPVHDRLSEVSPDNPVYLTRVDGNSAFVNAKAMELAGINALTPDPPGGFILKKADGEPSGVLVNQAMNLVKDMIGQDSDELLQEKLGMAVAECVSYGLTGVHEAGVGPREIGILKKMADESALRIRVNAMLGEQEKPEFQEANLSEFFRENRIDNYADNMLWVKTIKLFFDGALGSRGAAFFQPYTDDPDNIGLLRCSEDYITEVGKAALENSMSVATHCIGIRGNALCLDAYEEALKEYPGSDHRFRIEHAQIVREEDIEKFAALEVIPAMQPTHCTSDKNMIADRIGDERCEYAYAWKSFLDKGLVIPAGSDFPVESVDPLLGIYAAVTRRLPGEDETGAWNKEQLMTIEEAIRGFTIWAAYAGFKEDVLGSIESGKYADFTILDKDITEGDPDDILETEVIYTIVGGKVEYQAGN